MTPESSESPPKRTHPPARRATDAYIGWGFCGVAGFGWVVVARVAQEAPVQAAIYAVFAAMVSIAGLGIVRLLVLHQLDRRAKARHRAAEVAAALAAAPRRRRGDRESTGEVLDAIEHGGRVSADGRIEQAEESPGR